MKKVVLVTAQCLVLLLAPLHAQAGLVYFDFSGTLTEVWDTEGVLDGHKVEAGAVYSGVFFYDAETPANPPPFDNVYTPASGGMMFEIGDFTVICESLLGIVLNAENHSMTAVTNGQTYDPHITWGGGGNIGESLI